MLTDIFAIETDKSGNVRSTSGPLFSGDLDPAFLDYDEYWNTEIQAKLSDFQEVSEQDYRDMLNRNGFFIDFNQKHLF